MQVGDESPIGISGRVVNEAAYWSNKNEDDVNVDDINNATVQFREEADDMLQVGRDRDDRPHCAGRPRVAFYPL